MTMQLLDAPPAPPPRRNWRPRTGWAAGTLAAAGILVLVGALNPLSHVVLSGPADIGSGVALLPVRTYGSLAPFTGGSDSSTGRDPLIVLGCAAIVVALLMAGRSPRMRWVRPLATLIGGLLVGGLAVVGASLFQSPTIGLGDFQLVTVFDAGAWLSLAGLVAAVAAIVLALRLPDDRPIPEPDLDTPPLGLPVIHTGQPPEGGLDHTGDTTLN